MSMASLAQSSGRVLITRDRQLAGRRGVQSLYLASTEMEPQIRAIADALGPPPGLPRCTVCNGDLETITVEQAAAVVPPYVASTQTDFARCQRCERVYWPGTHWPGLQAWRQSV